MIIRHLRKDEGLKSRRLMACAFSYSVDEKDPGDELKAEIIGAFDDDGETLMGQISLHEYNSSFCGHSLKCVGICGVSTYPEYRRSGCIREIFREIFRIAPERGWDVSMLFPFSYRYYRKFGYELIMKHQTLDVPFTALTHIPRDTAGKGVLYTGQPEVLEGLLSVSNAYAAAHNLCFFRDNGDMYSKTPVKDKNYTYLWSVNGVPSAYARVVPAQNGELEVAELVYTGVETLKGIIGFLRFYEGQFKRLRFPFLEYDSPVSFVLNTDRDIGVGCFDGVQGRLVNVEKSLASNAYPKKDSAEVIRIALKGDFIERNNGVYTVTYGKGNGSISVEFTPSYDDGFDASLPITSLSKLVYGSVPSYAIPYLEGIELVSENAAEKLAECFPQRPINLFERF